MHPSSARLLAPQPRLDNASSAATAAAFVVKPPRRTRRLPIADGRPALKYHDPCRADLSLGQHAPSNLPVTRSRQPHRLNTEP